MTKTALQSWHQLVESGDAEKLDELIADDAIFHSPVVHSPQVGKAKVIAYLSAATVVFGTPSFKYLREIVGDGEAVLEFELELQGIYINGIDMITWNDDQQITDFKVMIRPLKAINLIHQMMGNQLSQSRS